MLPQKSSLPLDSSHHFGYAIQPSARLQSVNTTALQMTSPPRLPGAPTRWACKHGAFSHLSLMHGYAAVGVSLALRLGAIASLCAPSVAARRQTTHTIAPRGERSVAPSLARCRFDFRIPNTASALPLSPHIAYPPSILGASEASPPAPRVMPLRFPLTVHRVCLCHHTYLSALHFGAERSDCARPSRDAAPIFVCRTPRGAQRSVCATSQLSLMPDALCR